MPRHYVPTAFRSTDSDFFFFAVCVRIVLHEPISYRWSETACERRNSVGVGSPEMIQHCFNEKTGDRTMRIRRAMAGVKLASLLASLYCSKVLHNA